MLTAAIFFYSLGQLPDNRRGVRGDSVFPLIGPEAQTKARRLKSKGVLNTLAGQICFSTRFVRG